MHLHHKLRNPLEYPHMVNATVYIVELDFPYIHVYDSYFMLPHPCTALISLSRVCAGCYQRSRQRGAGAVLRSMVENARELFGLIVATQLEDPHMEGLDFKQLFR